MTKPFDYQTLTQTLIDEIQGGTGLTAVLLNQSGTRPPFPFATFDIVSPYIEYGTDFIVDRPSVFEMLVSLEVHDDVSVNAIATISALRRHFKEIETRERLNQKGIVVAKVFDIENHNKLITFNYEYRPRFEMRLRVVDQTYTEETDEINGVSINGYTIERNT